MRFLLVGNPNVGKSTFFNVMTRSNVKVGNYTGITVDTTIKKMLGSDVTYLEDLPGTYSVVPNSLDEGVVTESILYGQYQGVVNIVDATHLKRNMHLTVQLLELGVPMVFVANMADELNRSGYRLDTNVMSEVMGVPVIRISATKAADTDALDFTKTLEEIEPHKALELDYGEYVERAISEIKYLLRLEVMQVKKRWLAIQLLEGNERIYDYVPLKRREEIKTIVENCERQIIREQMALSLKGYIFNIRRDYIHKVLAVSLMQIHEKNHVKSTNQKLDKILTSPYLGTGLFLVTLFLIYQISFGSGFLGLGSWLTDQFDVLYTDHFLVALTEMFDRIGLKRDEFISNMLIQGAFAGVGGILVFLPQIIILFTLLATLEGTGYMSRVAISLDDFLSKFGLNGKAIVPMVAGLGCSVPAVMATRTIPNKRERLLTMLTLPFISCSARLPIYGFFVSIFFERYEALVMMFLYFIGTAIALLSSKLFSLTYFKNDGTSFALELPPYRIPHFKTIISQSFDRAKSFLKKAGTVIFVGSMVIWFLTVVGPNGMTDIASESYLAYLSGYIAPMFAPLGFGTWQATSALITGVLAKEVVVSSLSVIYGAGNIGLYFTAQTAFVFVVFSALYTPCISTLATIRAESNSKRWTWFAALYPLLVAYLVALVITGIFMIF